MVELSPPGVRGQTLQPFLHLVKGAVTQTRPHFLPHPNTPVSLESLFMIILIYLFLSTRCDAQFLGVRRIVVTVSSAEEQFL